MTNTAWSGGALAEILTQLLAGAAGQHHVGHDEVDFPGAVFLLVLFVSLQGMGQIGGGQNFKAGAFQNAAGGLADEGFVFDEENDAARGEFVIFTLIFALIFTLGAQIRLKRHGFSP